MSANNYRICKKLVLDTSYPGISFDADGICDQYHNFYNKVLPFWQPNDQGRKKLHDILALIKAGRQRNSPYDCIIGLSGGADSSFMLHLMVTEFDLKPLVFHVDGGWNTEISVNNVNALVDKLNLELLTEVIHWDEMRNFQLAMFKSGVSYIDIPQDMAFISVLYKFADKHNIKWILNGGNISTECIPIPLDILYWGTDIVHIRDILKRFGTIPMPTYPFTSIFYHKIWLRYGKGVKVIKPLNYVPYNKEDSMKFLEKEYGFKPYPQKHFESRFTRFFEGYWLPTRFGFDMRRVQLSSLIITGQLSRDAALSKLEHPPLDPDFANNEFSYVAAKLGISRDELKGYLEMPKKNYSDYANQKVIFDIGEWILYHVAGTRRGGAF